jgi:hypothetical protein
MAMQVINFSIGPELRARLKDVAQKTGHAESELIRKGLLLLLDKIDKSKKPELEPSTRR